MRILIAGSSGLVGKALARSLEKKGNKVFKLVRKASADKNTILWNSETGEVQLSELENFDAVVNLAGETIFSLRWTHDKKRRILESRVKSTQNLCKALAQLKNPPKVLVNASASGFYGSRGDEILTENSSQGEGFLADVCREWEEATQTASKHGIRVVLLRTGVVLSSEGGALAKMLLPFKMGLGGVLGSGKQYMSWIALKDLVGIIDFAIKNETVRGAVNAVSPNPVTNYEYTKTLGKVLQRPTIFPVPAFVIKLLFGEMGEEIFLSSARLEPKRLQEAGFEFQYADLEHALQKECL